MPSKKQSIFGLAACAGLATLAASVIADPATQPGGGMPDFQLPPGWTMEDMEKMMAAGIPGEMHAFLAKGVGTWTGESKMWMSPDAPPVTSASTWTVSELLDGRFFKTEVKGDVPGMGPFQGIGVNGYDNTTKEFVATWIDNMSTGIMNGTGELSADHKTMTWNFEHNCPIAEKPVKFKEVMTFVNDYTQKVEMWGTDPKTGKMQKCMEFDMKKAR